MKSKKSYACPTIYIETFIPEEYISVCYSLSCSVGSRTENPVDHTIWPSNEWVGSGRKQYFEEEHASSGSGNCSDTAANYLTVDSKGNFMSLEEWRSDLNNGKGAFLKGTKTGYYDSNGSGKCDAGDYIAWNTVNGNRTWHHWGIATAADAKHPNHS